MTQMSCGRYLKETNRDGSESFPISGRYLVTDKKHSATNEVRSNELSMPQLDQNDNFKVSI